MSVWTVIVVNVFNGEYSAHKMYGSPDSEPAWDQAVEDQPGKTYKPVAIFKGDFAGAVITERDLEEKRNE